MAEEQIQKLTTALYSEGVEKGEKKASEIIEQAQTRATRILSEARADAEQIIKEAQTQAITYKQHIETETRIAAKEIIHDFHQTVVDMILTRTIDDKLSADLADTGKLSPWIGKIIENWKCDSKEQPSLTILLSEKDLAAFNKWFVREVSETLRNKVVIKASENIGSGFQIIPGDGSYKIDMGIDAFRELFRHYLKARTRKLLFDDNL